MRAKNEEDAGEEKGIPLFWVTYVVHEGDPVGVGERSTWVIMGEEVSGMA